MKLPPFADLSAKSGLGGTWVAEAITRRKFGIYSLPEFARYSSIRSAISSAVITPNCSAQNILSGLSTRHLEGPRAIAAGVGRSAIANSTANPIAHLWQSAKLHSESLRPCLGMAERVAETAQGLAGHE